MFYNPERDLWVSVHGDDFTVLGHIDDLNWFQKEIKPKFETKVGGIIGPEDTDDKSVKVLNRIGQWTQDGIEYEADQRHAESIVRDSGPNKISQTAATPGVKCSSEKPDRQVNNSALAHVSATQYRAIVARANYLPQDRSDI